MASHPLIPITRPAVRVYSRLRRFNCPLVWPLMNDDILMAAIHWIFNLNQDCSIITAFLLKGEPLFCSYPDLKHTYKFFQLSPCRTKNRSPHGTLHSTAHCFPHSTLAPSRVAFVKPISAKSQVYRTGSRFMSFLYIGKARA